MTRKWQVTWYDPAWMDGKLWGKVELTDEYYDQPKRMSMPQAEFVVYPNLKIEIIEVHDDDDDEWRGMPKYIEAQIKREAKQIFKDDGNQFF